MFKPLQLMRKLKHVFWLCVTVALFAGGIAKAQISSAQIQGSNPSGICLGGTAQVQINGNFAANNAFSFYLQDVINTGPNSYISLGVQNGVGGAYTVNIPATLPGAPFTGTAGTSLVLLVTASSPTAPPAAGTYALQGTVIPATALNVAPSATSVLTVSAQPVGTFTLQKSVGVGTATALSTASAVQNNVCLGSDLILEARFASSTAAATDMYQWYQGSFAIPGASGTVTRGTAGTDDIVSLTVPMATFSASGVYSVKITTVGGCSVTSGNYNVAVQNAPGTPTLSASAINVCQNAMSPIITAVSAGATTYNWFEVATPATSVGTAASMTASTATVGTQSYQVTVGNTFGCTVTSVNPIAITVNPVPTALTVTGARGMAALAAGPVAICSGESVQLSVSNSTPGTVFNWSGGAGSAIANPTVSNVTASTVYTVSGVLGICTTTATIAVNVTANPAIPNLTTDGATTVCYGKPRTITGAPAPGTNTYQWYEVGAGLVTGATSPSIVTNAASLNAQLGVVGGSGLIYDQMTSSSKNYDFYLRVTGPGPLNCTSQTTTQRIIIQPGTGPLTSVVPAAPLCSGTAQTLAVTSVPATAPTGTFFVWSGPGYAATFSAAPSFGIPGTVANTGTYTVSALYGSCTETATMAVVINLQPVALAVTAQGPTGEICTNQTLGLIASNTAGTPTGTFTWSAGSGISATNVANPTISGLTDPSASKQGTGYSYTVTVNNNGCISTNTTSVLVVARPVALAATGQGGTVCSGEAITLTTPNTAADGVGTGTLFSWNGPGGYASTNISQPSVTSSATTANDGVYSVVVSNRACASTSSVSVRVRVMPTAMASVSPNPVCGGAPVQLSSDGGNMTGPTAPAPTYAWAGGGVFTMNAKSPLIAGGLIGTTTGNGYNYTVTIQNGSNGSGMACSSTATTSINVFTTPIASLAQTDQQVCAGSPLIINALQSNDVNSGTTRYSFTGPNGYVFNSTNAAATVSGSAALNMDGVYNVVVSNNICTSSASVNVKVYAKPSASASTTTSPVCQGTPINLNSSTTALASSVNTPAVVTYDWGTLYGTFVRTAQNPTVATLVGTTAGNGYVFSVTIQNGFAGCTSSATTSVLVYSKPILSVTNGQGSAVCSGEAITLNAQGNPLTTVDAMTTYSWTGPVTPMTPTTASPTVTNSATTAHDGTYIVTAVNGGVCTTTGSTSVRVNVMPVATVGLVRPQICSGNAANLTTGAGNLPAAQVPTYKWAGGAAPYTFNSTMANPTVNGLIGSLMGNGYNYTVTIQNGSNGSGVACSSTATTSVLVYLTPNASLAATLTPACEGTPLLISALNSSDVFSGVTTYSFTGPNGFTSNSTNAGVAMGNATLAMDGVYNVTAATGICTSTASVNVKVYAKPSASASTTTSPVCQGTPINLNSSTTALASSANTPAVVTYDWGTLYGSFVRTAQNPTVSTLIGTTGGNGYVFSVTIQNGFAGCTSSATTSVNVFSRPVLTVSNGQGNAVCSGEAITLNAQGGTTVDAMTTYSWTGPVTPMTPTTASPTVTNSATTAHDGTYIVTAVNGGVCTTTGSTSVRVNVMPVATVGLVRPQICSGNAANLTTGAGNLPAAQVPTYKWAGGAAPYTFNSTMANPTVNGLIGSVTGNGYNYTVTIQNGSNGSGVACSSTATTSVLVYLTPNASLAATLTPACEGTPLLISALNSSDVLSGVTTYSFTGPNGFTSNSTNAGAAMGNATLAMDGVYNVTAATGICTSTASVNVKVYAKPSASATTTTSPVCQGTPINLNSSTTALASSVNTPAVVTYDWGTLYGSFVRTAQNPTVSTLIGTTGGNGYVFSVTIQNGFAGCVSTATTSVNVFSRPVLTVSNGQGNAVCSGQAITLNAQGGTTVDAMTTYSWTGPVTPMTPTTASPTVTNSATVANDGTYIVTAVNGGVCTTTGSTSVRVNVMPVATLVGVPRVSCTGTPITLQTTAGALPAAQVPTYAWAGGAGAYTFNSTEASPVVNNLVGSGTGNGYNYTVTIQNGSSGAGVACSSTATTSVVVYLSPAITASTGQGTRICAGGPLTLQASGGATVGPLTTYSWTGPNGFSATTSSPTVALSATVANTGNYVVTVLNPGGCSTSASISVTVYMKPVVSIQGGTSVCEGTSIPLTANHGVTAGPLPSYTWTGFGTFDATSQTPTVATLAGTPTGNTYIFTVNAYHVGVPAGCETTQTVAIVSFSKPSISAVTGQGASVCSGTAITLGIGIPGMGTVGSATTYAWTGPNSFSNAGSAPTVTNTATTANSGSYMVTATNGVAGCSASASVSVRVFVTPTSPSISASQTICSGTSANLTTDGGGVAGESTTTYTWAGGAAPYTYTSTLQNPVIAGLAGTGSGNGYNYTVTVRNGQNGAGVACQATNSTNVIVFLAPSITAVTGQGASVCSGTLLNLGVMASPSISASTTYMWTGPNSFSSNTSSPTVSATATTAMSGIYTVVAMNPGGSCTGSSTISVKVFLTPSAPSISATQSICTGTSASLTTDGGGVAGESTTTYRWTGGAAPYTYSSTLQNPVIAGLAGTGSGNGYNYTVTVRNGQDGAGVACQATNSTNVIVFLAPTVTAFTGVGASVCTGTLINLGVSGGATVGGATTYAWTGPNGFSSASITPTVSSSATTAMSGTYTVVATNPGGCTGSATTSVRVYTKPVATAPSAALKVCDGQPFDLTVTPGTSESTVTYAWSGFGTLSSSTTQNPTVSSGLVGTATGNGYVFSVTISNVAPGCTATATNNIIAYSPATLTAAAPVTICAGTTTPTTLTVGGAPTGAMYAWTGPNGFAATGAAPTLLTVAGSAAANGVYSVRVSTDGNCTATSTMMVNVCAPPTVNLLVNNPVFDGNPINLSAQITGLNTSCVTSVIFTGPNAYSVSVFSPAISGMTTPLTSTINSGVVRTPIASDVTRGTYYVQVITGTCGTVTAQVVANNTPTVPVVITASATPNPATVGNNVALMASNGGTAYAWSGPNGFASTMQNPSIGSVTLAGAGVYTVTATTSAGTSTATVSLGVSAAPVVVVRTANLSIIKDILYRTVQSGDVVYITIAVINDGPDAATNVVVRDVLPAGMTYVTMPFAQIGSISHSAGTVTGTIPSIASGRTALLRFNVRIVGTLNQLIINAAEVMSADQMDPNSTPGNGNVLEDDYDVQDVRIVAVPSSRIAVGETSNDGLTISTYPNPASDKVTVEINGTEAGPAMIQMTDAMGRKVGSWNLNEDTTSHKAEINVSKFNAGTYFIRAEMNGKVISKKVMKGIE